MSDFLTDWRLYYWALVGGASLLTLVWQMHAGSVIDLDDPMPTWLRAHYRRNHK